VLQEQKGELEISVLVLKEQLALCASVDRAHRLAEDLQTLYKEQKRQRI